MIDNIKPGDKIYHIDLTKSVNGIFTSYTLSFDLCEVQSVRVKDIPSHELQKLFIKGGGWILFSAVAYTDYYTLDLECFMDLYTKAIKKLKGIIEGRFIYDPELKMKYLDRLNETHKEIKKAIASQVITKPISIYFHIK